ncbi:MAG: hypothetical protein WBF17_24585, partial [Phycisphaerae bacterium]
MPLRHRVVLGFVLIAPACLPCRADDPNRTAYWVAEDTHSVWENPDNWADPNGDPLGCYPDNSSGHNWTCVFRVELEHIYVGLQWSHSVSYIEVDSVEAGEDFGQVQLQAWGSDRSYLTVDQTVTNYGHLDIENLRVTVNILNRWVLDFDNVEMVGNVWNQA